MTPAAKTAIKALVSIGLIGVVVWKAGAHDVWRSLLSVDPKSLAGVVAILLVIHLLLAWRWCVVAAAIGLPLSFLTALRLVLIGAFFNQVLPSSVGGDVVRVWLLGRGGGVGLGRAFNSVFLDRLVGLLGMGVLVACGAPLLASLQHVGGLAPVLAGFGIAVIVGIAVLAMLDRLPLPTALRRLPGVRHLAQTAVDTRRLFASPGRLAGTLVLALAVQLVIGGSTWIIVRTMGLDAALPIILVLMPLVLLTTLVPISVAGWGVREGAMVVALGLIGIPSADALTVSLALGLATTIAGLPGGLVWLVTRDKRLPVALDLDPAEARRVS